VNVKDARVCLILPLADLPDDTEFVKVGGSTPYRLKRDLKVKFMREDKLCPLSIDEDQVYALKEDWSDIQVLQSNTKVVVMFDTISDAADILNDMLDERDAK